MVFFTYLILEKEWRYQVQCKHQGFFILSSFWNIPALSVLIFTGQIGWWRNQMKLFSPYSSAISCVLILKYRYEKECQISAGSTAKGMSQFSSMTHQCPVESRMGRMINCVYLLKFCRRRNHWAERWKILSVFFQNCESIMQTVLFQGCRFFLYRSLGEIYRLIVLSKLWFVR